MKTLLLAIAAASLVACSAAAPSGEAGEQGAAVEANAPIATATDPLCVYAKGHPFNGNGGVWIFDGQTVLSTTTFYWHGDPLVNTSQLVAGEPVTGGTSDLEIVTASATFDLVANDYGFDTTVHQAGQDDVATVARPCHMFDDSAQR